ncbi:MAG: coiled-coil domain-containing protein, partial [Brevibacillus sp.]
MRTLMLCLLLLALPLTATALAQEQLPLEQLILQQHFTQKELERTLTLIRQEENRLHGEIAQLDLDLQRKKLVMDAMRRHAGEVAKAYYTGERANLLTLLFDTKNFNDFLLLFDFLQILYERDLTKLEAYQKERAAMTSLQAERQNRLTLLQNLR